MPKKICSICNENKKKKKLLDGFVCKNCLDKCGLFQFQFSPKKVSADTIRKAIAASEINKERLAIFNPTTKIKKCISFDENNRLWKPRIDVVFRYEDIISFETEINKETVTSGNTGKAVVGGLLFGGIGAVAGASGKRRSKEVVTGKQIKIITRNELYPIVTIFCSPYTIKDHASEIIAQLSLIIDSLNNKSTSATDVSDADEILKYKKLLDDGIITNEEFEAKKKQLLNL